MVDLRSDKYFAIQRSIFPTWSGEKVPLPVSNCIQYAVIFSAPWESHDRGERTRAYKCREFPHGAALQFDDLTVCSSKPCIRYFLTSLQVGFWFFSIQISKYLWELLCHPNVSSEFSAGFPDHTQISVCSLGQKLAAVRNPATFCNCTDSGIYPRTQLSNIEWRRQLLPH